MKGFYLTEQELIELRVAQSHTGEDEESKVNTGACIEQINYLIVKEW